MKRLFFPMIAAATLFSACGDNANNPLPSAADTSKVDTSNQAAVVVADEIQSDSITSTTVEFESLDGLLITADKSEMPSNNTWVLLCHQAGFSRGEYLETACEFNERGFNTLAIDQRSGQSANNIDNETAKRATEAGLPTNYADAEQDIRAAIDYVYELSGGEPIIICGSSYSSSLVLKIGAGNEKVSAILSFSPGEYYQGESVQSWATAIDKPLFVTSSKPEAEGVSVLLEKMNTEYVNHFIPAEEGVHGSRALWPTQNNNQEYWEALSFFLINVTLEEAGL